MTIVGSWSKGHYTVLCIFNSLHNLSQSLVSFHKHMSTKCGTKPPSAVAIPFNDDTDQIQEDGEAGEGRVGVGVS